MLKANYTYRQIFIFHKMLLQLVVVEIFNSLDNIYQPHKKVLCK